MDERIMKYFQGELTPEERIKLLREACLEDELKKEMSTYQNIRGLMHLTATAKNQIAGHQAYKSFVRQKKKADLISLFKRTVSYASVIFLLIAVTWMLASRQTSPDYMAGVQEQELFVPAGQRARIVLPDGTVAWLNAGSTLTYPSRFDGERKVSLTGEGFFDVAKDPDKPFIVSTETAEIMALGTQFNVYSYEKADYMCTSLIEGSVKIYRSGKEASSRTLEPGQQLYLTATGYRLEETTDRDKLLWREGIYSFRREPLEKILKKLELYFDVEINVDNPEILSYIYTGKFRQRDGVAEILRIIQKIHPFQVEADEHLSRFTLRN